MVRSIAGATLDAMSDGTCLLQWHPTKHTAVLRGPVYSVQRITTYVVSQGPSMASPLGTKLFAEKGPLPLCPFVHCLFGNTLDWKVCNRLAAWGRQQQGWISRSQGPIGELGGPRALLGAARILS